MEKECGMCTTDDTGQGEWQLFPPLSTAVEAIVRRLPENAGIDDIYRAILESQCGATDDSQPVEQYDGTLGVTTAFVNAHQAPVGQLQWNDNLAAIYTNPGNVSGVRWCTGALVANDLFLTAGHCFDQLNGPPPIG
jgi:Trypsin